MGREREREGEKHQCVVASRAPTTGDPACNPGICPDWESNLEPFGSQADAQSTEPHQPGLKWGVEENLITGLLAKVWAESTRAGAAAKAPQ